MIGNDVVDLGLADVQSNWTRKGFLEKVFSLVEQELITSAIDRDRMVWLLWSMKEAAYKVHQRRYKLPRRLNWLIEECEIFSINRNEAFGKVSIEDATYYTSTSLTTDALFTTAVYEKNREFRNVLLKREAGEARKRLKEEIAARLLLSPDELHFQKDTTGIPFIAYRDRPVFSSFSLTGHGRFSGYSCALINS